MKLNLTVLMILLICVAPLSGWAEEVIAPVQEPDPRAIQIEKLEDQGEYAEAAKLCEEVLAGGGLTDQDILAVRSKYETLNWKLLFSRNPTSSSIVHVVKPGDNLYNIARANHTTVELIKRINGLKSDTIYPDMKLKVETGSFSAVVDKSDNLLTVYLEGKPLKTYRVATGTDNGTPTGKFRIVNKLENPTWFHAGAIVPPESPENILGTRWLGFDLQGYGIHGTTLPDSIGKQETAGCVRMLNSEVEELYDLMPVGAEVTVVD